SVQNANTEQLAPVNGGNVSTTALPPIGPNGEVQGPTDQMPVANGSMTINGGVGNGSTTTLPPVGGLPNSSGRDLTGGLTVEKLLGRWTVVSGGDQCPLNLTQTQKGATGRYRASAPACALSGMSAVASWQLTGSQVQLFDEQGRIIAALILSGNRFIGTLSGGQGISMVG
ncbi:MAG: AprI/Inh family metalloprotease inhibitor, partial [Devosia sp.]